MLTKFCTGIFFKLEFANFGISARVIVEIMSCKGDKNTLAGLFKLFKLF